MQDFDVIIKDGIVIDGTGAQRYRADVGIRGGRIAKIGRLPSAASRRTLDAGGMVVAPGFVDLHTHYDAQLFWDPYLTLSGWHGVTSAVIGNCGFGFAPIRPEMRERAMLTMTRVEAIPYESMRSGLPWDWVTYPEFLGSVDRAPKAVNVLPYVPVAPLLIWVMGFERAKAGVLPTEAEHRELCRLLGEAMDAGGCGWSAQRLHPEGPGSVQRDYDGGPMVTDVMHDETALRFAAVLAERNQGFMQMALATADGSHDFQHIEQLAEVSGRPILYNVVQSFVRHPEAHRVLIAWLDSCRQRGVRVYGQGVTTTAAFTFTFEDWNLFDDDPAWMEATVGSVAERKQKLADPARRPRLRDYQSGIVTVPIPDITIVDAFAPETKPFENLTIAEVAARTGKHPVDAMLDVAVADDLRTVFYAEPANVNREALREIVGYEWIVPGVSDGGAHTKFFTGGRYPTEFLSRIVREEAMCSLEHAHWRLSALPAHCAGFRDRGTLAEGAPADIVVYDLAKLECLPSEVVHDFPGGEWRRIQRARGYRFVLVNGEVTIEDDCETGRHSGRLLRHGAMQ
ncbi:MAG TPA: amidohydrolase family protein [Candidatus Eisenbacteria bacterium]|nr:amidohydrolase family protein [Candidatus Eisenbacteria bacterium]